MKNSCHYLATILLSIFFCSCATAPQGPQLPPVVTISGSIRIDRVKGALIDAYVAEGCQLERESDHMLSFVKRNDNAFAGALYGSKYDSNVTNREIVTISTTGNTTTLRASQSIVTNYGSAFERTTPTSGSGGRRLAAVKASLEN
jgi:hypothetical protein